MNERSEVEWFTPEILKLRWEAETRRQRKQHGKL
jgi:hypothetical protein